MTSRRFKQGLNAILKRLSLRSPCWKVKYSFEDKWLSYKVVWSEKTIRGYYVVGHYPTYKQAHEKAKELNAKKKKPNDRLHS